MANETTQDETLDGKMTYVNVALNANETLQLLTAKEKSGIRGSADLVRFLISQYVRSE